MDLTEPNAKYSQFILRVADHLNTRFPQYASCLRDEIHGRKMTNDRWNNIAAILCSLAGLPGVAFNQSEHDVRNPALSAVVVAQKMASVTFGGGRVDVEMSLEFCDYIVAEIDERISNAEGNQSGP